jgi:hypothetical protein
MAIFGAHALRFPVVILWPTGALSLAAALGHVFAAQSTGGFG